jgi:uncharacterized protein
MAEISSNSEVQRLAAGSYVALTTFRKDGTAVSTPVWVSVDADRLLALTDAGSGKVKRIRNDPRVQLAPCDARGRPQGSAVEATARLVDDQAGLARIVALHKAKYGLQFRFFDVAGRLLRRGSGNIGIEITVA